MRVIEKQMIEATRKGRHWKSGNTEVKHDRMAKAIHPPYGADHDAALVYLHGHHIATWIDGDLQITLAGWNTPTTRSRLTALCQAFKPGCLGVSTRLGQARILYNKPSQYGDVLAQIISHTEWVTV